MSGARIGRPPICGGCGECERCRRAAKARAAYQAMTPQQRKEWIGNRDPERVLANDRARYYRNRAARLELNRQWAQNNPDKRREIYNRWAEKNPQQLKANYTVSNAIRDGRLIRKPCEVCGTTERVEAHHDDYGKPLDVRWLCKTHHKMHHRKYPEAA